MAKNIAVLTHFATKPFELSDSDLTNEPIPNCTFCFINCNYFQIQQNTGKIGMKQKRGNYAINKKNFKNPSIEKEMILRKSGRQLSLSVHIHLI